MKKVLSFVLVLAMILGCTSMAFATEFKDQAEVTNTEAVAVLNAVGVLEGDDAGNMRPTATLTRAEACAIIARLKLGTTAAKKLTATVAPFADVAADNWAAGYIAFCASEGIVAGVGNNKFNPTGTLKVGEFGKMLLCVLGYNAETEKLTGSDWANNTAKLMVKAGITVTQSNNDDCAREVAAQLALNALKATCVDYEHKGTNITIGNATINVGGDSAADLPATGYVEYIKNGTSPALQLAEQIYNKGTTAKLTVEKTYDDYGHAANKWEYDGKVVGTFVSEKPVMTATTAIKGADLYATLGETAKLKYVNSKVSKASDAAVQGFISSVTTAATTTTDVAVKDMKAKSQTLGGNGVITEIYKTTVAGEYKVVQMVPVLAQVTVVANNVETASEGAKTVYTVKLDDDRVVTLTKYTTVVDKAHDVTNFVYDGELKKLDYVMIYGPSAKFVVTAASKVEGLLTGKSSKNIVLDGTKYSFVYGTTDGPFVLNAKEKNIVILDSYGYAIKSTKAAGQYLFVLEYATNAAFVDETTKKVSYSDYMTAVLADGTFVEAKATGGATEGAKKLYSYTVDTKGKYTLTVATYAAVSTINQTSNLSGSALYANNVTKYYVAQKTAGKYSGVVAYTGFANMPKLTNASGRAFAMVDGTNAAGLAKYVFIDYGATNSADADYVYFIGSRSVDTTTYTTYDVIINAETTTMKLATTAALKGLYAVEDGVATAVAGNDVYTSNSISYVEGNLFLGTTVDTYLCNVGEAVPVYYYDGLGNVATYTAAQLYQKAFSVLVLDWNDAKTAVEAIYICK